MDHVEHDGSRAKVKWDALPHKDIRVAAESHIQRRRDIASLDRRARLRGASRAQSAHLKEPV